MKTLTHSKWLFMNSVIVKSLVLRNLVVLAFALTSVIAFADPKSNGPLIQKPGATQNQNSNAQTQVKPESFKVAMLQMKVRVGDINTIVQDIIDGYNRAIAMGADLVVVPEGVLPGYPAWDYYKRKDYIKAADQALEFLKQYTRNKSAALLVGHITDNPKPQGKPWINVATLLDNGVAVFNQAKTLLPTYGVFDDGRYFEPARRNNIFTFRGVKLGIAICEDWWYDDLHDGRRIYSGRDPIKSFRKNPVDIAISLSASPFMSGKLKVRDDIHANAMRDVNSPLIYVNQVAGVDSLIFDGSSFVMDAYGNVKVRLNNFKPDFEVVEFKWNPSSELYEVNQLLANPNRPLIEIYNSASSFVTSFENGNSANIESMFTKEFKFEFKNILDGISLGLKEYMASTRSTKVVFGLSGGLDSVITAAIAAHTIGPENVYVIMMPSKWSSDGSIDHSLPLIKHLGIPDENVFTISIEGPYSAFVETLNKSLPPEMLKQFTVPTVGIPFQNIQARSRMILEYFVSNVVPGTLKLHTGDLSEILMSYTTQYGDAAGAYGLLHSLFKTRVQKMGYFLNRYIFKSEVIPSVVLEKPPSAELAPGQKTEEDLVSYPLLDALLHDYLINNYSHQELLDKHSQMNPKDPGWVDKILMRLYNYAQWKINQGPPGAMVDVNASSLRRRLPNSAIANPQFDATRIILNNNVESLNEYLSPYTQLQCQGIFN